MAGRFRHVTPVRARDATGRTARVYAQVADDFGMARMPVFRTLSPAPDVLAATWAVLRESLLAGDAPRSAKEVVALGVSMANRCPFCVDAHTTLLHATGDHRLAEVVAGGGTPDDPFHAALLAWARDGGPAPDPAAEYLGTALAFHFVNRMVSALLTEDLLPAGLQRSRLVRSAGGRALAGAVRRELPAGASLPLVEGLPARSEPAWAAGTPLGAAYAVLRAVTEAGGELLSAAARAAVLDTVSGWDGTHPPMNGAWLNGPLAPLDVEDRAGTRLALLVALAPYRVTDADVAAWRGARPDEDVVRLFAFAAITATTALEPRLAATMPYAGRRS
ncbi:carboxymuconolactone decarboxylase family protein [Nonomuraea terrae]|uniref:carboxymuconolactone decarboxylase family protein n=1 Tax=Nonomuraea terrae TaxID=2530383 RepID=UPI0037BBC598